MKEIQIHCLGELVISHSEKNRQAHTTFNEMLQRQTLKPLLQGLLVRTELFSRALQYTGASGHEISKHIVCNCHKK
jgi:hypothetical protein